MAQLSKQLLGLVLPHDTYGTQLHGSGKTIDPLKELEKFKKAGQVLSNIWSETTIDDFTLTATCVDISDNAANFKSFIDVNLGIRQLEIHVHISKYLLQITKYKSNTCCKSLHINVQEILGRKFLPTPLVLSKDSSLPNHKDKGAKSKFRDFYKSSALQHLCPKGYEQYITLSSDLDCPSAVPDDEDSVFTYYKHRKICTTKELLKCYLKAM